MNRAEQIRKEILLQLYATAPVPVSAERIERDSQKQGYDYRKAEIAKELQFLTDDGLLIGGDQPGTTARLYRISASGIRHYEQNFAA